MEPPASPSCPAPGRCRGRPAEPAPNFARSGEEPPGGSPGTKRVTGRLSGRGRAARVPPLLPVSPPCARVPLPLPVSPPRRAPAAPGEAGGRLGSGGGPSSSCRGWVAWPEVRWGRLLLPRGFELEERDKSSVAPLRFRLRSAAPLPAQRRLVGASSPGLPTPKLRERCWSKATRPSERKTARKRI